MAIVLTFPASSATSSSFPFTNCVHRRRRYIFPTILLHSPGRLPPPHRRRRRLLRPFNASSGVRRQILLVVPAMRPSDQDGAANGASDHGDDNAKGENPDSIPAEIHASGFPLPKVPGWAKLVLVITIVLAAVPFRRQILRIEDAMEKGAKKVAKMVETAAGKAGKAAKEVTHKLPAGSLKVTLEEIERMATEVEKRAAVAGFVIEKVDAITDKVEAFVGDQKTDQIHDHDHVQEMIDKSKPDQEDQQPKAQ